MPQAARSSEQQGQRVQRKANDRPLPADTNTGLTDTDAEDAAKRALEARDAENKRLSEENKALADRANKAGSAAAAATTARMGDREAAIANGMAAAKRTVEQATASYKAARAAGDLDGEMAALDVLGDAKLELKLFEGQKAAFDAEKPNLEKQAKAMAEPVTSTPGQSDQAKKWIDDHPLFQTDAKYKADALMAHREAMALNIATNSDAYPAFLNTHLARLYGADHGKTAAEDRRDDDRREHREMNRASTGAPPGREQDGRSVRHAGGNLRVVRDREGNEGVSGDIPAEWVEAAKWCNMDVEEYALEQLKITAEGGANNTYRPDGVTYR